MTNSYDIAKFNNQEIKKRKLVLHFDQHNTIQVACTLPGRKLTVEEGLNHFLTSAVWGKEVDNEWMWISDKPEIKKPRNEPDAVTYFRYLEKKLVGTPDDRAELKKMTCRFVYQEPGLKFREYFDLYLQTLIYKTNDIFNNNSNELKLPPNTIQAGDPSNIFLYHLILPEFFDMIIKLQKEKRDFSIILRTMGIDSKHFLETVKPVFEGKHRDIRDIEPMKINTNIGQMKRSENDKFILEMDGEIFDTEDKIYKKLNSLEGVNAIRDDFAFWQSNRYECYSAKPLWINLKDKNYHHIIFDDNIRLDSVDDCIVNIRLSNSDENFVNVDFKSYNLFKKSSILQPNLIELLNPHLRKNSTKNYYLEMIKIAEENYQNLLQERQKISIYTKESGFNSIDLSESLDLKLKEDKEENKKQSNLCSII